MHNFAPVNLIRSTLWPLLLALPLAHCSQPARDQSPPIARVETQILTADELAAGSPMYYYSPGEAAERWVDDQVLNYHALRSGHVDRRKFDRLFKIYERQVLRGVLLDSLLLRHLRSVSWSPEAYYQAHPEEFRLTERAALVTHVGFPLAAQARAALDRLRSAPSSRDSLMSLYNFDRQVVRRSRLIPQLGTAIFAAQPGVLVGLVTSPFGYHIFLVEQFYAKGESIPYPLVEKQIYERLFYQQLAPARSAILDSLREALEIELYNR